MIKKAYQEKNVGVIVGDGEVGRALWLVLVGKFPIYLFGRHNIREISEEVYCLHICFPYSKEFEREVKKYQKLYQPKFTVIHSTVPVGTSRKLKAIHSPVIGIHPFLDKALTIFTKFLGGEKASEIADYFRRAGFKVYLFDKPETTELMKLLSTTHYGLEIEFVKEVKRLCSKYKVPFEAWTLWVENYNQGYEKLGFPEYKKPNLVPIMKRIGGHCVLPNCDLLDSKFADLIKKLNA